MKNTSFKIEDVFDDTIKKDNFSRGKITKPKKFLAKVLWKINLV